MNKNILEYGIRRVLCMAAFDIKEGGDDIIELYLHLSGHEKEKTEDIETIKGFNICSDKYPSVVQIHKRFNNDRKFIKNMANNLWNDYQEETGYKKPAHQLNYKEEHEKAMEWLSVENRLIAVAVRSIFKISKETDAISFLNDLLKIEGELPKSLVDIQHCHCGYVDSKELIKRFDESFFLIHSIRNDLARSFVTPS